MHFYTIELIFLFLIPNILAVKPPGCFKPCLHTIASWGEGGISNLTNICSNHLSFIGCLNDVCNDLHFIQARDHLLGTCKSNNIDYELITNSTTLTIIKDNEKNSVNSMVPDLSDIEMQIKNIALSNYNITEIYKSKSITEDRVDEKKVRNSDENMEEHITPPNVFDVEKLEEDNILLPVIDKVLPIHKTLNQVQYFDVKNTNDENTQQVNDPRGELLSSEVASKNIDARLISSRFGDHDIANKVSDAVSHRLPEPEVKFYKKFKPVYDSDGIEIDHNDLTNSLSEQDMKNKNQKFFKHQNQPSDGNSRVLNSKAANHMPMLNDN